MKETGYLVQATLIATWWAGLASSPAFFSAFQFEQIPPTAFWAFLLPDVVLIAGLSLVRAYRVYVGIELVILGAMGYAALYCCHATLLTGSGFLPTGLMLLGLAYNGFLCFHERLFRVSSTRLKGNAVKTLIQIVSIWVLALLVVPYVILDAFGAALSPSPGPWLVLGGVLFCGCSLLGLASSLYLVRDGQGTPLPLDQTNRLVTSGPYRYVRNPMAIAGIGQGLAIAAMFQSIPILVYALLGAVVWHVVVRPIEERDMRLRFGIAYEDYCHRVSCWLPKLSRTEAPDGDHA